MGNASWRGGGDGRYILRAPFTARLTKAAVLAAAIESIEQVLGRPASFKTIKLYDKRARLQERAVRAREIARDMEREAALINDVWQRLVEGLSPKPPRELVQLSEP